MNSALSRRTPSTAICLFCRQTLRQQQQQTAARQWVKSPQQQRRHFQIQHSSVTASAPSPPAVLFGAPRGRRFLSASTAAAPVAAEQDADTPSAAAATNPTAVPTSFKRYSLYPETVAAPMTMRPPPPPPPVEALDEDSDAGATMQPGKTAASESEAAAVASKTPWAPTKTTTAASNTTTAAAAAAAATTTAATAAPPSTVPKPTKRPSRLRTPRKAPMRLTAAAVDQVRELLEGPEPKLLKVGVRNRGCSGLAYNLEYVEKPGPFDELVEQDGVRVLVDSKALFSIIGSEMDWVEDKLSQRFVFRNPNIKEQCGCGESFMV